MLPWLANDQVEKLGGQIAPTRRVSIDAEIEAEIAAAISFAEESPFPTADALDTHVFASS
jgi:TPP-dependent pyruvate/acetoin dehydrogenase alpha subunit